MSGVRGRKEWNDDPEGMKAVAEFFEKEGMPEKAEEYMKMYKRIKRANEIIKGESFTDKLKRKGGELLKKFLAVGGVTVLATTGFFVTNEANESVEKVLGPKKHEKQPTENVVKNNMPTKTDGKTEMTAFYVKNKGKTR